MRLPQQAFFWVGIFMVVLAGCQKEPKPQGEQPLAQVFGKTLYPSDVEGIVGPEVSPKDSAILVNNFIENWAREQLLIAIAEQNIPADFDVDRMVADYRKSLIRDYYERKLIEQRLDSAVNAAEIIRYYEEVKDRYQLDKTIVRAYYIQIPSDAPEQDELKKHLAFNNEEEDLAFLIQYCKNYADKYLIADSTWLNAEDLVAEFPNGTLSEGNFIPNYRQTIVKGEKAYFLLINEVVNKGNIAPLSYVRPKIVTVILRKRKLDLLESMTDELFQRELKKNNVKIYTQ